MWANIPLFPERASSLARDVDLLYLFAVAVAIFFSLLIAALVLYFMVRYRRRSADEVGQPERAGLWLEVLWSVIPLGILLFMFGWGAKVYFTAMRPPADAVEYFVVGKQWMWKFQHPEGNREINHLHVPLNQPIKLTMTSEDVIHSFYVPAFRVKADVLPDRYTTIWFTATKTGSFRLFCAEYCGAEHSRMGGTITVMEPLDYQAWLAGERPGKAAPASGEELFASLACSTCHRIDSSVIAPRLHGAFGKEAELANGEVVLVDENYLRESILEPAAKVVKGYRPVMPTYQGQISEEQLMELIAYIKSIGDEGAGGAAAEPASAAIEDEGDETTRG